MTERRRITDGARSPTALTPSSQRRCLLHWGIVGTAAVCVSRWSFAQSAQDDDEAGPPADAPLLRPGDRVRMPNGRVMIETFNKSFAQRQQETTFTIRFIFHNTSTNGSRLETRDLVRLVADGVPRAPVEWFPGSATVPADSAQDGWATFRVRGRPRVVHVQFGVDERSGRAFLRWPD